MIPSPANDPAPISDIPLALGFVIPSPPWQRGAVENTNRRAREWLSREVDPVSVTDADLNEIFN